MRRENDIGKESNEIVIGKNRRGNGVVKGREKRRRRAGRENRSEK